MMKKIKLSDNEVKKPIAVDINGNFLTIEDITEKVALAILGTLEQKIQRELVLERNRLEDDYEIEIINGRRISKSVLMEEIENKTPLGNDAVIAELSYLSDIHSEISPRDGIDDPFSKPIPTPIWPPKKYRVIPKSWWSYFFRRRVVFPEDTSSTITGSAAKFRIKIVHPCFTKRKFIKIVLTDVQDIRTNFAPACKKKGVVFISGVGHGSPSLYTGYQGNRLWEACHYSPEEVKNTIIHLLSCKTAQKLGPDLIKKGACAYFGYNENFTITWNHPEEFWKCDSVIDLALCYGLNAENTAKLAIRYYDSSINRMRGIHGPTAIWLTWDRDALRTPIHGNQYGSKKCTLYRVPFFEYLERKLQEKELKDLEIVELKEEEINIIEVIDKMIKDI